MSSQNDLMNDTFAANLRGGLIAGSNDDIAKYASAPALWIVSISATSVGMSFANRVRILPCIIPTAQYVPVLASTAVRNSVFVMAWVFAGGVYLEPMKARLLKGV
jgi:hypothetical protein